MSSDAFSLRASLVLVAFLAAACGSSGGGGGSGGGDGGGSGGGGGGDGGIPSSTLIVASAGGEVQSEDGLFTLYVPPGALAEDTEVAIRAVPESEWPVEIAAAAPLAGVYDITPDGLEFVTPAYAVHHFSAVPAALVAGADHAVARHYSRSADGTIDPSGDTETVIRHDGGADVIAEIDHLSWHFATTSVRLAEGDDVVLYYRFELDDSPHYVGDEWRGTQFVFHANEPLDIVGLRAMAFVSSGALPYSSPIIEPGGDTRVEPGRVFDEHHMRTLVWSLPPATITGDTTIPANTPQPLVTPVPGFRCDDVGSETDLAAVVGRIAFADGFLQFRAPYEFINAGAITCLGPLAAGPKPGVGVVVGDFCEATRETSTITCLTGMTGSLANVILPTASVEAQLTEIDATTTIFEGVTTWESVAGPPVLDIATATQTVTATHDGTSYVIAGLTTGPVFTHPENLSVTGTPPAETDPVTVEVPSIDLNDVFYGSLLEDVNGLSTEMRFADGDFDAMYVHATATGSGMAGEAGVIRLVPASAMAIDGANIRHAPLFDTATLTELGTRGLTIDTILVGPVRLVTSEAFFPGETIPVVAGRFHRFDAALLESPPAGECVPDTADLALAVAGRASLCYDLATAVCGMQHQDGCGLSTQIGYFVNSAGDFRFVVDVNDTIVSASHGTINVSPGLTNRIQALPEDTDVTIVIDVAVGFGTDHVSFTFRRTANVVEILDLALVPES